MAYTGPVVPDLKLYDDQTKDLLETVSKVPWPPRVGEILPGVQNYPRWVVTRVGELEVGDWSKSPPELYWPVYGHKI